MSDPGDRPGTEFLVGNPWPGDGWVRRRYVDHVEPERLCTYCGGPIAVRNPTGRCDHLYWPDYVTRPTWPPTDGPNDWIGYGEVKP